MKETFGNDEAANQFRGTPAELNFLLSMRHNMQHYARFLNRYAPCVVSNRVWNDKAKMQDACSGSSELFSQMLTVSDETFLLLVISNYSARWFAELQRESHKVCNISVLCYNSMQQTTSLMLRSAMMILFLLDQ